MTREDIGAILSIVSMMLAVGVFIDANWFFRERFMKHLIKKTKANWRCVLCKRPITLTEGEQ